MLINALLGLFVLTSIALAWSIVTDRTLLVLGLFLLDSALTYRTLDLLWQSAAAA